MSGRSWPWPLELLAAQDVDLVPRFFARFYTDHPQDKAMFHNPGSSHGAMVTEIMDTLLALASGEDWVELMLRNQVRTHHDHGDIPLERYAQQILPSQTAVKTSAVG